MDDPTMDKKQELRKAQVPEFTASLFAWPAMMAASVGEAFAASLARPPAEHEPAAERRPFWTIFPATRVVPRR
jgi:hypothetical protein